jgi:hypothetical protein
MHQLTPTSPTPTSLSTRAPRLAPPLVPSSPAARRTCGARSPASPPPSPTLARLPEPRSPSCTSLTPIPRPRHPPASSGVSPSCLWRLERAPSRPLTFAEGISVTGTRMLRTGLFQLVALAFLSAPALGMLVLRVPSRWLNVLETYVRARVYNLIRLYITH